MKNSSTLILIVLVLCGVIFSSIVIDKIDTIDRSLTQQDSLVITLKTLLKESEKRQKEYKKYAETIGSALYSFAKLDTVTDLTRKQIEKILNDNGFDVTIETK